MAGVYLSVTEAVYSTGNSKSVHIFKAIGVGKASLQVNLQPDVLRWARERTRYDPDALARKMGINPERVVEWEKSGRLTAAQADKLARHTHTPLGFLFLPEPPEERLPIPDFRGRENSFGSAPSPELLDTVHAMQARQAWMRDELIEDGVAPLDFVGMYRRSDEPAEVANAMRDALGLPRDWAERCASWSHALLFIRKSMEDAGIMVVINGVVGNNTHRPLDPEEFRGFALVDEYAPLIFINNVDFKSAQMFTLAHELAHIFIGEEGISNFANFQPAPLDTERSCDAAAAEFLVPEHGLREAWDDVRNTPDVYRAIARHFKVSRIVGARRALDLDLINRKAFLEFYNRYLVDERRKKATNQEGGDFWNIQNTRIGRRFGAAVWRAAQEGRLLYRDAYVLTGLRGETFDKIPDWAEGV